MLALADAHECRLARLGTLQCVGVELCYSGLTAMAFEERMDAITMNLELMGRRLGDTRREAEERHQKWQHEWEAHQRVVGLEMAHLREQGAVLLKATTQMLAVADAHDRRIARLERFSA